MKAIMVVNYDPNWPIVFEQLRQHIWRAVSDLATSIEHVGSTSVPGLAAKPIIDVDVVIPADATMSAAVSRLALLGYVHQGNLGVQGREAFRSPDSTPRHHLYCCASGSLALRNHLAVRDLLRANPDVARQYGNLKMRLAVRHSSDLDAYTEGKTDAIAGILKAAGFSPEELAVVQRVNRRSNE